MVQYERVVQLEDRASERQLDVPYVGAEAKANQSRPTSATDGVLSLANMLNKLEQN